MNVLIDNKDLYADYGIKILDYTDVLSFPSERENERKWSTKSGVDRNLVNARYEAKEFSLHCYVKDTNEVIAYNKINTLVEYMLDKKVFVLSLRDSARGIRECYLCERSKVINAKVNVRYQNGLYVFKLGLKDVNPNAIKYKTTVASNEATIAYTKGQTASIFWGDGSQGLVDNSGNYTKDDYASDGLIDIIIDIDKTLPDISGLSADFSADKLSIIKPETVNFTDLSTGSISVWSWIISRGGITIYTSSEQNPSIEFDEVGTFTVTLQVFNEAAGSDTETKVDYITSRSARKKISSTGSKLITSTNFKAIT